MLKMMLLRLVFVNTPVPHLCEVSKLPAEVFRAPIAGRIFRYQVQWYYSSPGGPRKVPFTPGKPHNPKPNVPPKTKTGLSFLSPVWRFLKSFEWKRMLMGDIAVPSGTKRILKLKKRDRMPMDADLVLNSHVEGYLRGVITIANLVFLYLMVSVIIWGWTSNFNFTISHYPSRKKFGNPFIFHEKYQYAVVFMFACWLFFGLNYIRYRTVLRVYYEASKDMFTLITINVFNRIVHLPVKSGNVKEIFKKPGRITIANIQLLKDDGTLRRRVFVNYDEFILPWYQNRFLGTDPGDPFNLMDTDTVKKSTGRPTTKQLPETTAERRARVNAERLETQRQSR